ncbi:MAG: hypothetical protein ABEH40_04060 [Haloferacaceae archaeon]
MADGYRGVVGAFPYALRTSDSWLFRSYAAVSAVVVAAVAVLFAAGVIGLIAATSGVEGGTLTLSRAFFVVVGLLVVGPVLAPTLLVARRHRRGGGGDPRYDAALALAGYAFLGSLYVGLLIASPAAFERIPGGPAAPLVAALYALPRAAGLAPPLAGAAGIALAHRRAG